MEILATAIGATIGLMLVANAALQQALDPVTALIVVHAVGLVLALPLAVVFRPAPSPGKPVPWPLFTGGLVGIALLWINNHTIPLLGVGLTVGLGVVGQIAASAAVDHWGLFGLRRRPLGMPQVFGVLIALAGVFVMSLGEA